MKPKITKEWIVLDSRKLLQEIEELKSRAIDLGCQWAEAHGKNQKLKEITKVDFNLESIGVEYQLVKKSLEALLSLHYFLNWESD